MLLAPSINSDPPIQTSSIIQGISLVAPPRPIKIHALQELRELGATHVAIIPYGFSRPDEAKLWFNLPQQWWGERLEGARACIRMAHEAGLQVMLKPQVYVPGSWIGELNFTSNKEWEQWENHYREYIMACATLASEEDIGLFCIGTEARTSIDKRPSFWEKLIAEVRGEYCGQLTYSANWDNYHRIPFWEKLDYIGVSSYFPLSDVSTPKVHVLKKAWKKQVEELRTISKEHGRPVLFTEYGYLSVDGAVGKTWELEKKVHSLKINEEAQANALKALYDVFYEERFWAGGFLWKWFPEGMGHEGYFEKDYTPQGKEAQSIIEKRFK